MGDKTEGSYFLTEEGEKVLPERLREEIDEYTSKNKLRSSKDAIDMLNKITDKKLRDYATNSRATYPELIALSVLYGIKKSE